MKSTRCSLGGILLLHERTNRAPSEHRCSTYCNDHESAQELKRIQILINYQLDLWSLVFIQLLAVEAVHRFDGKPAER
jgi:hypothetical protein